MLIVSHLRRFAARFARSRTRPALGRLPQVEPLEGRRHMDGTLLGHLGQSPVAVLSITRTSGDITTRVLGLQTPGGNLVIPGNPIFDPIPGNPVVPGLLIALTPAGPN